MKTLLLLLISVGFAFACDREGEHNRSVPGKDGKNNTSLMGSDQMGGMGSPESSNTPTTTTPTSTTTSAPPPAEPKCHWGKSCKRYTTKETCEEGHSTWVHCPDKDCKNFGGPRIAHIRKVEFKRQGCIWDSDFKKCDSPSNAHSFIAEATVSEKSFPGFQSLEVDCQTIANHLFCRDYGETPEQKKILGDVSMETTDAFMNDCELKTWTESI